jgi:organic radical activating enzyme
MTTEHEHKLSERKYHQSLVIGKDGKVHLPHIRFYLAFGCNLKCEQCIYAFQQGIVSKETLFDSFEKWSRKISAKLVRLYGGEPLLNPDIADIVIAVKNYWRHSQCLILTNGILLPRLPDSTIQIFAENDVRIQISQHIDTQEYREILAQSLPRLKRFRVQYHVDQSFHRWHKTYDIDSDGVPVPCHSNMEIAYRNCVAKHCVLVHGDYLYRCVGLANKIMAAQAGLLGAEWNDRIFAYKPVTFENSPAEIRDYLRSGAIPECSVCPETRELIEHRQLSMEEVESIKYHIEQRNKSILVTG